MSIWHLIIILIIVLIFFGPQRLEGLGTSLGKAIRGFKKGLEEGEHDDIKKETGKHNEAEIKRIEHLSEKEKEKV